MMFLFKLPTALMAPDSAVTHILYENYIKVTKKCSILDMSEHLIFLTWTKPPMSSVEESHGYPQVYNRKGLNS